MTKHVAVLKGGLSSERDVSLATGAAVAEALQSFGKYKISELDVGQDISSILSKVKPDVVFNGLHGTYGEDGCLQGILEYLKIPYTHSGVMASAVAMHKPTAKILFETTGIKCAEGRVLSYGDLLANDPIARPFVIKPVADGSSVGIYIILDGDDIAAKVGDISHDKLLLVEKFISGRELTVAVFDGKPMGVIEIAPKDGWYDYGNKYIAGNTQYIIPAHIPKNIYDMAMEQAAKAHIVLGCRGVTRSDFRYSDVDGELYILELNTHPGMTATSLVPKLAEYNGISFTELCDRLVEIAQNDIL